MWCDRLSSVTLLTDHPQMLSNEHPGWADGDMQRERCTVVKFSKCMAYHSGNEILMNLGQLR